MSNSDPLIMPPKLKLSQKIFLKIFGRCKIGSVKEEGWKDKIPLFAFYCNKHGIMSSLPLGSNNMLICSSCLEERKISEELAELEIQQIIDDEGLIHSQQNNTIYV